MNIVIESVKVTLDNIVKWDAFFEHNTPELRQKIKNRVESYLIGMVDANLIFDHVVLCDDSNNTVERIAANEFWLDVGVRVNEEDEFIYIPVRVYNGGAE